MDSLEVLIKDNTKRFSEVFRQLPYGIIKKCYRYRSYHFGLGCGK